MRSKSIADGIRIIVGRLTGETSTTTQAYRFDKDKFSATEAREWLKSNDVNYISFEAAINNIVDLYSIGNAITGTHDAILQRLDTLIKNNGRMIHYSSEAFQNVHQWVGIPVVFADTVGEPLNHPSGESVMTGNLPDNMRIVGRVVNASLGTGEPILRGEIEIDDPALDKMTSAGEMSLSTGFSASISNVNGQDKIVGNVVPNHVLIFRRGACRNCYPNDNSARFENVQEDEIMDEESKGLLKSIKEALVNLKPAESVQEEIKSMDTEELKNITEERDALKAKIEAMENAAAQAKADAEWVQIKNALPVGWLGDKEAETRKDFEASPAAFMVKFAEFKNSAEGGKAAEGSATGGETIDAENLAEAEVKKFEKEYGLHFIN